MESPERSERLKDTAAVMGPIWGVIAVLAAPLMAMGGAGPWILLVAIVLAAVPTLLMAGVSLGRPTGKGAEVVERLGEKPRGFFRRIADRLRGLGINGGAVLRGLVGFAVGALLVGLASGVVSGGPSLLTPCPQPLELRLISSAENVPALRDAALRFARQEASPRGCAPVRITVDRQPPLLEMAEGARTAWYDPATTIQSAHRSLIGIHPDIWIASSKATQDYVVSAFKNFGSTAELVPMGSVGTSALVVAVTPGLAERMDRTTAARGDVKSMAKLLSSASVSAGRGLLRPRADLSEVALIASAGLLPDGREPADEINTEIGLTPPDLPLTDGATLLCQVRSDLARGDDKGLAMVVPEHLVHVFKEDPPTGPCNTRRYGADLRVYPLSDLPSLDYRFVGMRWRGQWLAERDGWVRQFHAWLANDQLRGYGYRSPTGTLKGAQLGDSVALHPERVGDVGALIDRVRGAHPGMSFLMLADSSRSMDNPLAGDSALQVARTAGLELVGRLRDGTDTVTFASFSSTGGPVRAEPGGGTDAVAKRLNSLTVDGADAPLGDALADAAELVSKAHKPVIVMLTDGATSAGDVAGSVAALKKVPGLDVLLLLTGAKTCQTKHIAELTKAADKQITCASLVSSTINEELVELWIANK